MIKNIYLDLDGTLVDFKSAVVDKNIYNPIKNTINWEMLKGLGSEFWSELQFLREGARLYAWLYKYCIDQKINLCILSTASYEACEAGKKEWIEKNLKINPMCIYFVKRNTDKTRFADENSLLIDDFGPTVQQFILAGGKAIKFKNDAKATIEKLRLVIDEE